MPVRNALLVAVLGAGSMAAGSAYAAEVSMQAFGFVPATLTVQKGATVVWTNRDDVPHSVTAADGRFDSGPVAPGKSFEWVAPDDRPVAYHCIYHPSMTGSIKITAKP